VILGVELNRSWFNWFRDGLLDARFHLSRSRQWAWSFGLGCVAVVWNVHSRPTEDADDASKVNGSLALAKTCSRRNLREVAHDDTTSQAAVRSPNRSRIDQQRLSIAQQPSPVAW